LHQGDTRKAHNQQRLKTLNTLFYNDNICAELGFVSFYIYSEVAQA